MEAFTVHEPRRDDGRLSARVTSPQGETEIWYSVSHGEISPYADAFLAATLLPAMRCGVPLRMEAPVSPRLLEAVPRIQQLFNGWNRRYKRVPVDASTRDDAGDDQRGEAACFFSCGADSFYAALRNGDEIGALVYATPYEPKVVGTPIQATLDANVRAAARELGKPLVEIETNIRLVWEGWLSWEFFFGAALASLGLAVSPRFGKLLIPPGLRSRGHLVPWGSHPELDPLWSTEEVEFEHIDVEISRFDRTAFISESDIAMRYLQICWEHRNDEYNCCRCEKCLRAMMTLHVLGKLDGCPAFPLPLTPEAVGELRIVGKHVRDQDLEVLRALEATGRDEELAKALRKALKRRPIAGAKRSIGRRWRAMPVN